MKIPNKLILCNACYIFAFQLSLLYMMFNLIWSFSMKRIFYILFALIFTLMFTQSCKETATTPDNTYSFSGFVFDSDNNPIENALVEIIDLESKVLYTTNTSEIGKFEFKTVSQDALEMQMRISAEGFKTQIKSANDFMKDNKPTNIEVKLSKQQEDDDCCGVLNIKVVKFESDVVLENAEVKLTKDGEVIATIKTDANGMAQFTKLCEGKHFIRIALDGYKVIEDYKIMGDCDTLNAEFGLKVSENNDCCNSNAIFTIKDQDGNLLKNVTVLFRRNGVVKYEGKTNDNGKLTIDNICKGEYSLLIKLDSYKSQEFVLEFDCSVSVEKSITMIKNNDVECCNNIIKVNVKDSLNGNALEGVKLILWQDGKMIHYAYSKDGFVAIDGICKGKYVAELYHESYKSIEWVVEFDCQKTLEFNKVILKKEGTDCCGKSIIVVKNYETGEVIKNADVKITFNNTSKTTKTDDNGKAYFDGLCKGKHWIRVSIDGFDVVEDYLYIENCENTVDKLVKLKAKNNQDCCDNQLKFTIKDEDGNLLSNVQIKIMKGGAVITTLTTQNGTAATDKNLCKGEYSIRIAREGYNVMEYGVSLNCNDVKEFTKTLTKKVECCTAWAKVFVYDNDDKSALNGAKVKIYKNGTLLKTLTVENGYVKFENLCEGKHGFDIIADGYKSIEWSYEIKCNNDNVFEKFLIKN